ncbi:hypothetical protein [Novosphingobium sp. EMRT-2]|uniref:hypothetical protein n=1 Tax=Novosphingobium sp. EMRT-2 TaxID=2571749 RepID=UPI0010BDAE5F|nr:hypothetical protein [Novosphingobium sp. EMRT-2]QCI92133.1 hypothetical protein FA702_00140 [Novosphingobium sp. EMRT-2]
MTINATNVPVAHTLNPAIFLAEFVDLGGGYCLTPDGKVRLAVFCVDGHEDGRDEALQLIRHLTPNDLATISSYLRMTACQRVLAPSPTNIACSLSSDPAWAELAADLRAKFAAWLAAIDVEQEADGAFDAAAAGLPPQPVKPGSAINGEIRDANDAAEFMAKWDEYERDYAAWKEQRAELRSKIVGPAKAEYDRTHAAYSGALNTLMSYRTNNLRDLREKIEIIIADYDGSPIAHEYVRDILADVSRLAGEE